MNRPLSYFFYAALLFFTQLTVAQDTAIAGTVTDETGVPLPGANIVEKGTTNGVTADFDGNFSIELSTENPILTVSYIGYSSKDVPVGDQISITVVLSEDAARLDEVVVVGYGTQNKKDLTGAIVSIKPEEFTPGVNTDATQLLNGSAAGVSVSQVSSAPGAGLKVQVRGAGSINSSNSVLFVVDGLPGVDPASLSPQDIESMEVLKDASSAAIYGTRAANGVVLITTKKGRAGRTSVTYNTYVGQQSVTNSVDVLGASDYMQLINLRLDAGGNPAKYSSEEISAAGAGTNWQDEMFRKATVTNHQIGVSSGTDKSNYYLGINYFNQDGVVKNSSNRKYNVRLNLQTRPMDKLSITTNVNFTQQKTNAILFSNAANEGAGPLSSGIQFDPSLPPTLDDDGRYFLNPSIALDNPLALLNGISDEEVSNRLYGSLTTSYEILDNLKATVRLGAEVNTTRSDDYRDRSTIRGLAQGGIAAIANEEYTHWLAEYTLDYKKTFQEKHDFSMLLGATFEEFLTREVEAEAGGLLSDITRTNLLQSGDGENQDNVSSSRQKNQLNGYLGRVTYGYDGKYLLTASFRIDGSSRFSEENKYAFFPSGSVGWKISEEHFADADWLDNLKLRVGYGELGNQGINNFETRYTLVPRNSANTVFNNQVALGLIPARVANPNLKWETTSEINAGIDYAVLGGRISGSIDYFNRVTKDQLFIKPLPGIVGFDEVRTNLGEVRNKGVDFQIKTINVDRKFKWTTNITAAFLKNEVSKLDDSDVIIGGSIGGFGLAYSIVKQGLPLRAFYGYEIDGIIQEGDDLDATPTPSVSGYGPGLPKFRDQNGDNVIDSEDRVSLGDPFPDFTYGINNTFQFGNLSLNVFVQGVQGIETLDLNVLEAIYPTNGFRNSISQYYLNRWTPENPTNEYSSGVDYSLHGGQSVNTWTVADASYFRMKNITLGYDIPLPDTIKLAGLKVFIAADNLFTLTPFEGYDPDASSTVNSPVERVSYNSYPLARVFRIGVDFKF